MTTSAARVRPLTRWIAPTEPATDLVARLAAELKLPATVCRLLAVRGYHEPEAARTFLRPRLEQLHPPKLMRGMEAAVERLARAVRDGETVLVHGDYDVDGMVSTTILVRTLRHLGGRVIPFIPHRVTDGYDLSAAGVLAARAAKASVLVTCDCGTSACGPVDELMQGGIDVVITDHHLPSSPAPQCLAVLNPRVPGCDYPDKDLCAAGVAFKLSIALLEEMHASTNIAFRMLDLVALATVADVAPLRGENRILVRYGLRLMEETQHPGLRALLLSSGIADKGITAGRVGYILAPRLNAVGRLGQAMRGVELLLSDDAGHANTIARELEEMNRSRQDLDKDTLAEARAMLERETACPVGVVLASPNWHPGVIGIVASRLVEEYYRPVVLIAVKDGVGKGSGRSIAPFDLHGGLSECREVLERFGGHRAAAGLTISEERIPEFAQCFDAVARARLTDEQLVPELRVDIELPIDEAGAELEVLLRHFEPFGMGNPAPVLASRGVRLAGPPRVIGAQGLKLRLAKSGGELEAVWWQGGERSGEFVSGATIDVAYRLELDHYFQPPRLVARVVDARS
jgi:single-stranded-DNA-specific exonuclease